jgi:hypothetical protein
VPRRAVRRFGGANDEGQDHSGPCLLFDLVAKADNGHDHQFHDSRSSCLRSQPTRRACGDCHQGKWADDHHGYNSAIDVDGFPLDPKHPFNKARGKARPSPRADADEGQPI